MEPATPELPTHTPIQFAIAVEIGDAPMAALEYSSNEGGSLAPALPAFRILLWVAVLSGLCVASCFLLLATSFHPLALALHLLIFASTIGLGVLGGVRTRQANLASRHAQTRMILDTIAGAGLLVLGLVPILFYPRPMDGEASGPIIGGAFLLMALTTLRHLLLYRGLADAVRVDGFRRLAGSLVTLGWFKTIYEGLWLLCCSTPLGMALPRSVLSEIEGIAVVTMFAAFLGCIGFGVIWILMIIAHARLVSVAGRGVVNDASPPDIWNAVEHGRIHPPV